MEHLSQLGLGIGLELPQRYAFSFQREVSGTQIFRFLVSPLPKFEEMMVGVAMTTESKVESDGFSTDTTQLGSSV